LLNPDGSVQKTAHRVPGTAGALLLVGAPLLPRPARLRAEPWRAQRPRDVGWAVAAALAGRTATLRRLGPFDPSAFLLYEDLDLCLRARAAGVPTELRPELVLRHRGGHAVNRAGEPLGAHAQRRREVVLARLGRRAPGGGAGRRGRDRAGRRADRLGGAGGGPGGCPGRGEDLRRGRVERR